MTKILILTNDSSLKKRVDVTLRYNGFEVRTAETTKNAWKNISEINFDLIMIDFQLKSESGLAFYKALRLHGLKTPLLMVGEGLQDEFILKDLSFDSYDYLLKPFNFADLKMKIKGLLERKDTCEEFVRYGNFRIDLAKQIIMVKNEFIKLGKTELKILVLLAKKAGQVVDLKSIMCALEKEDQYSPVKALFYIKKLSTKIESLSEDAFEIVSFQNNSFRLEYRS